MSRPYQEFVGRSHQNPHNATITSSDFVAGVTVEPVNLKAEDEAPSYGLLYRPPGGVSKVGIHLMHPRTNHMQNYSLIPFVNAGYTVLARNSRWPNNDSEMLHEAVLLDLAAGIARLQELGCEQVVLLGNSGGSALAAMYQAQARALPGKRITHTPAGDPFDLNGYTLPPAAAVIFLGGHAGQGVVLSRSIDPSVVDENNPILTDATLDMFDPANGFRRPPESSSYEPAFLERFRAAQLARIHRLDQRALELVRLQNDYRLAAKADPEDLRLERLAKTGFFMTVYRTTADPAFVDLSIDPDDRRVFSYVGPRPDVENYGESGLGRIVTPRAWLSTWSVNYSNAGSVANVARFTDPFLLVHYAGDCGTRMEDAKDIFAAAGGTDKEFYVVNHADHYGFLFHPDGSPGGRTWQGAEHALQWVRDRFPL